MDIEGVLNNSLFVVAPALDAVLREGRPNKPCKRTRRKTQNGLIGAKGGIAAAAPGSQTMSKHPMRAAGGTRQKESLHASAGVTKRQTRSEQRIRASRQTINNPQRRTHDTTAWLWYWLGRHAGGMLVSYIPGRRSRGSRRSALGISAGKRRKRTAAVCATDSAASRARRHGGEMRGK